MVKVIFTDGSEMNFHSADFRHQPEARRFIIEQPNSKYRVFVPDSNVKCCGVWDKEKGEFA